MPARRISFTIFWFAAMSLLAAGLLLGQPSNAAAQGSTTAADPMNMSMPGNATPAAGQPIITRTGWLSAQHGDPNPGSAGTMAMQTYIVDSQGKVTYLNMDYTQALHLAGQQVTVQGALTSVAQPEGKPSLDTLTVTSITAAARAQSITPQSVTGSHPWVNVLCRFSDQATTTPEPSSYFDGLTGSAAYPSVNHFWQEMSYGQVNINGTITAGWYNLTYPHSYYMSGSSFDLYQAAQDCANLATTVNFPNYTGVNFMFSGTLDCCAWGGSGQSLTTNGQTKWYSMTWMPPWGYETQSVMAHEMGHGFGLPHSAGGTSGGLGYPYTSDWDVMSSGGRACEVRSTTYGCVASGTISYHHDELGWIPAARKLTVNVGQQATITLERLDLPVSSTDYLMAQIPIPGGNKFYTVEARMKPGGTGYDNAIRADAVIIHQVDWSRSEPAHVTDSNSDGNNNVNDASAEWTPGKTYTDATNHISIAVTAKGTSSFTVTISNAYTTPTPVIDSIGIYRNGTFLLRLHNNQGFADLSVPFSAGTKPYPIVGDWTGAGFDSIGVFDQNSGTFYLRNTNTAGGADETFALGSANDVPLSGRWLSGATHAGVGVFRPSNGVIYLKNALTTGFADHSMIMGMPGDQGVASDWTGKGFDSPGVYRPGTGSFYLSNQVTDGAVFADIGLTYGSGSDLPIAGDWIAQGHDGVGMFRPGNGFVYLRNTLTTGFADNSFFYGTAGDVPVAGHWQVTYPPIAPPSNTTTPQNIMITKTAAPVPSAGQGSRIVPGDNQIGG